MNIVSFSGGKDSTAMLLMMIEHNIEIDEILFCDTGKEFPVMYDHIAKVEKYIDRKITTIKSEKSFEYWLGYYKRKRKNGTIQIGYGWADFQIRWCTGYLKRNVMNKYLKGKDYILYQGIAFDEQQRANKNNDGRKHKYPLIEWKITEKQALEYCYSKGFYWNGLYKDFNRVSCYCCPLQSLPELKTLFVKYPELWQNIKEMDKLSYRQFRSDYSLEQLEHKFKKKIYYENQQLKFNFA